MGRFISRYSTTLTCGDQSRNEGPGRETKSTSPLIYIEKKYPALKQYRYPCYISVSKLTVIYKESFKLDSFFKITEQNLNFFKWYVELPLALLWIFEQIKATAYEDRW